MPNPIDMSGAGRVGRKPRPPKEKYVDLSRYLKPGAGAGSLEGAASGPPRLGAPSPDPDSLARALKSPAGGAPSPGESVRSGSPFADSLRNESLASGPPEGHSERWSLVRAMEKFDQSPAKASVRREQFKYTAQMLQEADPDGSLSRQAGLDDLYEATMAFRSSKQWRELKKRTVGVDVPRPELKRMVLEAYIDFVDSVGGKGSEAPEGAAPSAPPKPSAPDYASELRSNGLLDQNGRVSKW